MLPQTLERSLDSSYFALTFTRCPLTANVKDSQQYCVESLCICLTRVSSVDTAATLQQLKDLPTGIHLVPIVIKDLQGYGKTQTAKVRICQCSRTGVCLAKERSVSFGGMGWLALLLPLLLLLLLCKSSSSSFSEYSTLLCCVSKNVLLIHICNFLCYCSITSSIFLYNKEGENRI